MLATLSDLLAPVSLSAFFERFRARTRLHISASDPTRAELLLSWRDIDILLSGHGLGENVGIWRDSVRVPRPFYTSHEGKQLKVSALHDLLSQGVSIVVNEVHRSIPQISQLAAAVEREMGIETQVNAYLSFSKAASLNRIGMWSRFRQNLEPTQWQPFSSISLLASEPCNSWTRRRRGG